MISIKDSKYFEVREILTSNFDFDKVEKILKSEFDPNYFPPEKKSFLELIIYGEERNLENTIKMIELFFSYGATPNIITKHRIYTIVDSVLNNCFGWNQVPALENGTRTTSPDDEYFLPIAKLLLDYGAILDTKYEIFQNKTLLLLLLLCENRNPHLEAIELLLTYGADPTIQDSDGSNAFELLEKNKYDRFYDLKKKIFYESLNKSKINSEPYVLK